MHDEIMGVTGTPIDVDAFDLARAAWEEVTLLLRAGVNAESYGEAFELYTSLQLYAWVRFREMVG